MILSRTEPCGHPARSDFGLDVVCVVLGFILFLLDFVFFRGSFFLFRPDFLARFPAIFPAPALRFPATPAIFPALALRSPADPYFHTNFRIYFVPRKK